VNEAEPDRMCFDCIADEVAELIAALHEHGATLTVEDDGLHLYGSPRRTIPVLLVRRVEQLRQPIAAVIAAEQIVNQTEASTDPGGTP
jgi:hypothetical protein